MYVNNFEQLQEALRLNKKIIYIVQDINITIPIRLNMSDIKIVGVLNNNKLPVINFNSNSLGIIITGHNYLLKNLIIEDSSDCGLRIKHNASYNKIENCIFRYNNNSGLSITKLSNNNTIINCFSYKNCDYKNYGKSADGFSCKLDAGPNNKFINCYSFENSDDGFDNYDNFNSVYYINCIAFNNGNYKLFGEHFKNKWQGNGNGFKLGSKNVTDITYRYIKNCIAFDNQMKGFDQNNAHFTIDINNTIAFNNKSNYKLDRVIFKSNNNNETYRNEKIINFCNQLKSICEQDKIIQKINFMEL